MIKTINIPTSTKVYENIADIPTIQREIKKMIEIENVKIAIVKGYFISNNTERTIIDTSDYTAVEYSTGLSINEIHKTIKATVQGATQKMHDVIAHMTLKGFNDHIQSKPLLNK